MRSRRLFQRVLRYKRNARMQKSKLKHGRPMFNLSRQCIVSSLSEEAQGLENTYQKLSESKKTGDWYNSAKRLDSIRSKLRDIEDQILDFIYQPGRAVKLKRQQNLVLFVRDKRVIKRFKKVWKCKRNSFVNFTAKIPRGTLAILTGHGLQNGVEVFDISIPDPKTGDLQHMHIRLEEREFTFNISQEEQDSLKKIALKYLLKKGLGNLNAYVKVQQLYEDTEEPELNKGETSELQSTSDSSSDAKPQTQKKRKKAKLRLQQDHKTCS